MTSLLKRWRPLRSKCSLFAFSGVPLSIISSTTVLQQHKTHNANVCTRPCPRNHSWQFHYVNITGIYHLPVLFRRSIHLGYTQSILSKHAFIYIARNSTFSNIKKNH